MRKTIYAIFIFIYSFLYADTPLLIIHSYHESYPWSANQSKGFKEVLDSAKDLYPLYSIEYLDTKRRIFDKEYETEVIHYMSSKYKGYQPKLIYTTDDDAFNFMLHNKEKLFPSTPLVFSGVNDISKHKIIADKHFSGVFEEKDVSTNIKLIKTLFPDEKELVLLGDNSTTATILEKHFTHSIEISGLRVHSIHGNSFEGTLEKLKTFKTKVVILTTIGGFKSKNGNLIPLKQVIDEIKNSGNFLILVLEDTYLQGNVIGGSLNKGVEHGKEAGKLALKILKNPTSSISETVLGKHHFIFNFKMLKELEIELPKEIAQKSELINQPESFAHKHEKELIIAVIVLIVLLVVGSIYFSLLMYRSKKIIITEGKKLAMISESMERAQTIAHLGNWDWDIKNNTLWWSNEIYRIFGLEPQEFEATYEAFISRVHPDDQEKINEAVNFALKNHSDYHIVHRIIQKDGTQRYVLEEGSLKLDEDNMPARMVGIVHDITEKFEQEQHILLQSEIFNAVQDSIMVHDLDGHFIYVNENAWKTRGYTKEEMLNMSVMELDAPEYTNAHPDEMKKFLQKMKDEGYVTFEVEHLCKNGDRLPVEIYSKLITLNEMQYVLSSVRDITQQKKARAEIERLSKVVEQIDDAVAITDNKGIVSYANQAFYNLTGYNKEEVFGKKLNLLKSGHHSNKYYQDLWNTILKGDVFRGTIINKKKNGELFYEKKTITPLKDEFKNVIGYISSGKDITMEAMLQQEMEHFASTDQLTGIYNRHKFEEIFILELERSRRFAHPLSLILIDIDHFKLVNDNYGHDVGDEVLKSLVDIVQSNIRKIDIFARWGGEEFLVLTPNTNLQDVFVLAEKLRLAVETSKFPVVQHITISIGISQLEPDDSLKEFFKRADKALYSAKENGRNQVSPQP